MPTRGVQTHLLAPDGFTWCNKVPEATLAVTDDPERVTCKHCLNTLAKGGRGRADRNAVRFSPRARWNPALPSESYQRYAEHGGRYFKAWRVQPWDKAKDRTWHLEEITADGEPEGHASLDPRYPGERRVVWVGGLYARVADLDEARRVVAEAAPPLRGGASE